MPIIGIASLNYKIQGLTNMRIPSTYVDVIRRCGGTPIGIPVINDDSYLDEIINNIDGLLMPGGADINPKWYNETIRPFTYGIDDELDRFQITLIQKALIKNLPLLGICRGHQALNVALGGSLYQDISDYNNNDLIEHDQLKVGLTYQDLIHEVNYKKGSLFNNLYGEKIMTNSFHHQIIKTLGKGLTAVGHTSDGVIEAMVAENYHYVVSVQYHPERSESQYPLITSFIKASQEKR